MSLRRQHLHSIRTFIKITAILLLLETSGYTTLFSGCSWAESQTAFYQSGVDAYHRGDYRQSAALLRYALTENPNSANTHYYLAVSLDMLNQYDEALSHYEYIVNHGNPHGQDHLLVEYANQRIDSLKRLCENELKTAWKSGNEPKSMVVVALKGPANALMIDAMVDGKIPATFILDTGATYTSISKDMAEALGINLEKCEKITITTANGRIQVPKITLDHITINGLEAANIEATVIDIRKGSSFSGLLGLSFIRQFKLTIDPQAGQIVLQNK